jgi:hypothetical protein
MDNGWNLRSCLCVHHLLLLPNRADCSISLKQQVFKQLQSASRGKLEEECSAPNLGICVAPCHFPYFLDLLQNSLVLSDQLHSRTADGHKPLLLDILGFGGHQQ